MASEELKSEQNNLEYFVQNKVCRFCLSCKTVTDIVSIETENISLIYKIKYCLDITITPNASSNKACGECIEKINNFFEFKSFCNENDRRSKVHYENILRCSNVGNLAVQLQNCDTKANDFVKKEPISEFESDNTFEDSQTHEEKVSEHVFIEIEKCDDLLKRQNSIKEEKRSPERGKCSKTPALNCKICKATSDTLENMQEHEIKVHGLVDGYYICYGCGKQFTSTKNRSPHEYVCKYLKNGYQCDYCKRYLPTRTFNESHMKEHMLNKFVELPKDLFKCRKCLLRFETKDLLNEHALAHVVNKTYICDECGSVFDHKVKMRKHWMIHNTDAKQFKCHLCDYRSCFNSSLKKHLRKHTGERPYSCHICPQKCTSKCNLNEHMKRRHSNEKKYQCTLCDKSFVVPTYLKNHMRAHSDERPFTCHVCGVNYKLKKGLDKHMQSKHTDISIKQT